MQALSSLLARQRVAKADPPRAEALDLALDRHRARPWSEVLFHGPNKKWAVKGADQIGAPSVARLRLRLLRAEGLEARMMLRPGSPPTISIPCLFTVFAGGRRERHV